MKKREKCYQILNNNVEIDGVLVTKSTIVYYDEIGLEETKENYDINTTIKEGYIPIYLNRDVPSLYESLDYEIQKIYLSVTADENSLDENGELTLISKERITNGIRLLYSEKISNIVNLQESIERFVLDNTQIPQLIIDERETLKLEYHNLISYLGL